MQKKSTDSQPYGLPSVALAKDGGGKTNLSYDISTLKMEKLFKFDVCLIAKKYSQKFSAKQKFLAAVCIFEIRSAQIYHSEKWLTTFAIYRMNLRQTDHLFSSISHSQ